MVARASAAPQNLGVSKALSPLPPDLRAPGDPSQGPRRLTRPAQNGPEAALVRDVPIEKLREGRVLAAPGIRRWIERRREVAIMARRGDRIYQGRR